MMVTVQEINTDLEHLGLGIEMLAAVETGGTGLAVLGGPRVPGAANRQECGGPGAGAETEIIEEGEAGVVRIPE